MRVLVRDGNELIDTKTFDRRRISIGSGADSDVRIPDHRLVARHASMIPENDGGWRLEVTGEGIPTMLNGRPVTKPSPLQHADEISIADYRICVFRSEGDGAEVDKPRPQTMVATEVLQMRAHPLPEGAIVKTSEDAVSLGGGVPTRMCSLANELRACVDVPRLIDHALDALLEMFTGRFAFACARRRDYGALEFEEGRGIDGRTDGPPPLFETYRFRCLDHGQRICLVEGPTPGIGSALVVPLTCGLGELGLLYVDRRPGADRYTAADLDLLVAHAAVFAARLEAIVSAQRDVQQSVSSAELAFVREIQMRMDPTVVPQWANLQMAAYCKPGTEATGDVYDVVRLPNGLAAVLLANVSGEGLDRSLVMVQLRSAFRSAAMHADAPHVFLRGVNWMLCDEKSQCHAHAFVVALNPASGDMQFSSAGDIGAVIVDQRGDTRDLTDLNNPPVGSAPNVAYQSRVDRLGAGESMALCTAGTFTVRDPTGEPLGQEGFLNCLRDGFGQSASVMLDELISDHHEFFKQGRQPDDISILIFHRASANT